MYSSEDSGGHFGLVIDVYCILRKLGYNFEFHGNNELVIDIIDINIAITNNTKQRHCVVPLLATKKKDIEYTQTYFRMFYIN